MLISPLTVLQGIGAVGKVLFSGTKPPSGETDTAKDSTSLRDVASIARKYDVRNISPRDMASLSTELYNAGHIPFPTHALLTSQPEMTQSGASASAMENSPRNYLAQLQKSLEQTANDPSRQAANEQKRIAVQVLQNLDSLRLLQTS